jgi:ubiquinone/menaquinone biosynthesis C-methylase UbiE
MNYIDMISKLGIGNAHPGGFAATLAQLERYPLRSGDHVLEVGCGTGRTACHLALNGCNVTAVDFHADMLEKARRRAMEMQVDVTWVQADACRMPFPNDSFDVIWVESVTNFTEIDAAVMEYFRILKPEGILYDRELTIQPTMALEQTARLVQYFGMRQLLRAEQWIDRLAACGFRQIERSEEAPFIDRSVEERNQHADPYEYIDEGLFHNEQVWKVAAGYFELMEDLHQELTYVLLRAMK